MQHLIRSNATLEQITRKSVKEVGFEGSSQKRRVKWVSSEGEYETRA